MKSEFERIQNRAPMEMLNMKRFSAFILIPTFHSLALSYRYELPGPPAGKLTDLTAWTEAVENSSAQLEHQATRQAFQQRFLSSFLPL